MSHTFFETSKTLRLAQVNGVWEPAAYAVSSGRNAETGSGAKRSYAAGNLDARLPEGEIAVQVCNDLPKPTAGAVKALVKSLGPVFKKYDVVSRQVAFRHKDHRFWVRRGGRTVSEQKDYYVMFATGTMKDGAGKLRQFFAKMGLVCDWALVEEKFAQVLEHELRETHIPAGTAEISGITDVVVANDAGGGVLFHEAIGHGLEQDLYPDGAFDAYEGKKPFKPFVQVYDDPTVPFAYGSYWFDHEGKPARKVALVKDRGIHETLKSELVGGARSNGHGRRQDWSHNPLVRMSCTYLAAGPSKPADVVASVKKGVYIEKIGGGQVNVKSGEFVFQASRARLIENGKLGARLAELSLKGDGVSVLRDISMVADDLDLSPLNLSTHAGTCGKGQGMEVSDTSPTFRTKMFVSA